MSVLYSACTKDYVAVDCRELRDPDAEPELRTHTGRSVVIQQRILQHEALDLGSATRNTYCQCVSEHAWNKHMCTVPHDAVDVLAGGTAKDGVLRAVHEALDTRPRHLVVYCRSGKHRSVAVAELLGAGTCMQGLLARMQH